MNVPSRHLYAMQMPIVPTLLGRSTALAKQGLEETD